MDFPNSLILSVFGSTIFQYLTTIILFTETKISKDCIVATGSGQEQLATDFEFYNDIRSLILTHLYSSPLPLHVGITLPNVLIVIFLCFNSNQPFFLLHHSIIRLWLNVADMQLSSSLVCYLLLVCCIDSLSEFSLTCKLLREHVNIIYMGHCGLQIWISAYYATFFKTKHIWENKVDYPYPYLFVNYVILLGHKLVGLSIA